MLPEVEKIINNKNKAITLLNQYLDECIIQTDYHRKKANLLSYWLQTYITYLKDEETFDSSDLKEYSRGDIIKVNLGFNVGNEEGGLHYCVVLDKKNAKSYSTLTVVPLSSLKPNAKIHNTSVFLGDEIYICLNSKNTNLLSNVKKQLNLLNEQLSLLKQLPEDTDEEIIIKNFKIEQISEKINSEYLKLELIGKISQELSQMKKGTIALINQITTISKQRIYNPKKDFDILSGIKLSDDKMKLIDNKIKKFFIN